MLKVQRVLGATLLALMSVPGARAQTNPCSVYNPSFMSAPLYEAGSKIWLGCVAQGDIEDSVCSGRSVLMPINDGNCHVCVRSDYADAVTNGSWNVFWGHPELTCHGCISPEPFWENFYAWLGLDERSGSVAVNWASYPNGNHYGNPARVPGRVNYGLQLDGVDDYVEVSDYGNILDFPGSFSIVAWIKVAPADLSGVRPIVEKRQQSPLRGYSFYLYRNPSNPNHLNGFQLAIQLADGSGSAGYANYGSSVTLPGTMDGGWHLVAVTINRNSSATFYVDGELLGQPVSITATPQSIANSSALRIGMTTAYAPSRFKGLIDEVLMFDRILSASEVRRFFDADVYGLCRWSSYPH